MTDYSYYNDGRVKDARHGASGNVEFDRSYSYDHVGRMTEGVSGGAARGLPPDPNEPDPYSQTYQYDTWSNLTKRTSSMWNHEINPFNGVYVNDRNTSWTYDEAGNLKNDGAGGVTTYDVANRVTKWESVFDTITQKYDGDGQAVRRVETRSDPLFTSTIYYLRSSVMGGLAVAEINTAGKREVGYVYANGMELARYRKPSLSQSFEVQWSHAEPMTGDRIEGGVSITTDPLGGLVPGSDPFVTPDVDYGDLLGGRESHTADSDPFSLGSGCTLDGVPIDCNVAISMANNGAASVAPLKSVTAVIYQGQTVLAFWQSYADGREGFVPVNAVYTGGGGFRPAGPPKYSDLRTSKKGDTDFRALNGVNDDDPEALLARSNSEPAMGQLGQGRVKVDYLDPQNRINPGIEGILYGFLNLPDCVNAYKDLEIDLEELLSKKGLVITPAGFVGSGNPQHTLSFLRLTQEGYNLVKENLNNSADAMSLIGPKYVTDAKHHIFITHQGMVKGYNGLKEALAHEIVHSRYGAKATLLTGWFGYHDLSYLGDKIEAVEKNCGKAPTPTNK